MLAGKQVLYAIIAKRYKMTKTWAGTTDSWIKSTYLYNTSDPHLHSRTVHLFYYVYPFTLQWRWSCIAQPLRSTIRSTTAMNECLWQFKLHWSGPDSFTRLKKLEWEQMMWRGSGNIFRVCLLSRSARKMRRDGYSCTPLSFMAVCIRAIWDCTWTFYCDIITYFQ